ncbi:LPP20 family lipoprotein [Marinospirillum perlucidum]|uniref:LPP20 family lipoprotein n=1 Tax=Marinospirillum perlucidum TaxID=1982602 RepID=UPI000DF1D0ED|nr:LPP20 family lipoprotein [Marinospirillum perlucidum]
MLKRTLYFGCLSLAFSLTLGCASSGDQPQDEQSAQQSGQNTQQQQQQSSSMLTNGFDPVVLRVEGYGAAGQAATATNSQQRRLLAMRASKMDAYRAMAERVYGARIQGNTSVQNLATRDDNIRAFVDNLVRGAKVISTKMEDDGTYVTEMELVLEPRFQHCMVNPGSMAADPTCNQYTVHGEQPNQRIPVSQSQPRTRYHLN